VLQERQQADRLGRQSNERRCRGVPSTYDSSEAGGEAATDSPQDQVAAGTDTASADAAQDAVPDSPDVGQEDATTSDGDGAIVDPRPFVINYVNDGTGADIRHPTVAGFHLGQLEASTSPRTGLPDMNGPSAPRPTPKHPALHQRGHAEPGQRQRADPAARRDVIYVTVRATNRTGYAGPLRPTESRSGASVEEPRCVRKLVAVGLA